MPRTVIGSKVREQRKLQGLTQAGLAARVGISASYLNLIEGNRRNIGGALLQRIADELQLPSDRFDGAAERRLVDELAEIALDPLLATTPPVPATAAELAARHPDWALALVSLHRACLDRGEAVTALSDRLNQDPQLGDAVHNLLTNVAAIRSAAEILEGGDDLEPPQRERFVAIIAGDSRRLSSVAQALAGLLTRARTDMRSITPAEQVDDFIIGRGNHFGGLERAADGLRAAARLSLGRVEGALIDHLARAHGVTVHHVPAAAMAVPVRHHPRFEPLTRTLDLLEVESEPTRRFLLARLVAQLGAEAAITAEVDAAVALTSEAARRSAALALASYVAGALLMPYDDFRAAAVATRYDIDLLARRFSASFEQVCHRLVALRRPGHEGVRFGFLRADPAGHVQKRFPLPRLALPRHGTACPLWPVYTAFQTPGATVRQLAEFPGGDRYLLIARAVEKDRSAPGMPRHLMSIMLMCDALNADETVYADGLDLSPQAPRTPVGLNCRICVRRDCTYRQEAPIVDLGPAPRGPRF